MILSIVTEDQVHTRQENIAHVVDAYYTRLLGSTTERTHGLNMEMLQLPVRDLAHLEEPFSEQEAARVIKSMPLDKAPGPVSRGDFTLPVGLSSEMIS